MGNGGPKAWAVKAFGWLAVVCLAATPTLAGGEIYGTIHLTDGKTLTGPIRWDVNENFWGDELNAVKREIVKKEDESYRIRLFGMKLGGGDSYISHAFSIPFGHLKSITSDHDVVFVKLKNDAEFEVRASSSDLGRNMRSLIIDDVELGIRDISWREFERVEFRQGPGAGRDADRLYGTVETEGETISGFIVWDRDESLAEDIIDGDDGRRDRKIPLGDIRVIEHRGRNGSRLTLKDDTTLELSGTNDIDDGHRGVQVLVSGIGFADIPWSSVRRVTFGDAPPSPRYEQFDGGHRLSGVVRTRDGRTLKGRITWDLDERWSWENLDGERDDIDWSIPFANIDSIALVRNHAEVRLRNSRMLMLSDSNDVNRDNKGIVVEREDGERYDLAWDDVITVTFD